MKNTNFGNSIFVRIYKLLENKKRFHFFAIYFSMLSLLMLTQQACTPTKFNSVPTSKGLPLSSSAADPICRFNGQIVRENETIEAYYSSTVPFETECKKENRTCHNGALSGSFEFAKCGVGAPASCLFNGQTVEHGKEIDSYLNSTTPFGTSCKGEKRTCKNGVLHGSTRFAVCTVGAPADCMLNGTTVKHGESTMGFPFSSVPYGKECIPQKRNCDNGALSGDALYGSCVVGLPASCLFDGKTILHSKDVDAFPASTVPYGAACVAQKRTCNDGSLDGDARYASCSETKPKACLFNGQTIGHEEVIIGYEKKTVPAGKECLKEERKCINGTLEGTFEQPSCTVNSSSKKNITVTESSTYSPFKLLLVIDNSYTMSQSQAQIAANIDSLLKPLAGKDVNVKIISTSDRNIQSTVKIFLTKADNSVSEIDYSVYSGKEYSNTEIVSIKYEYETHIYGDHVFTLSSTDSKTQSDDTLAGIKNYIIGLGVRGSVTEQVMCPIARQLFESGTNAFFKTGDKTAIVVLTDEDDASSLGNCLKSSSYTYGELKNTSYTPAYDNYDFTMKAVRVKFSYAMKTYASYRDGVFEIPETKYETYSTGSMLLGPDKMALADVDQGTCVAKAQSYLRSLGVVVNDYHNNEFDFSASVVASCEVESNPVKGYFDRYETTVNYCDLNNKTPGTNGQSLSEFANKNWFQDNLAEPRYINNKEKFGTWGWHFLYYTGTYAGECSPNPHAAVQYAGRSHTSEVGYYFDLTDTSDAKFDQNVVDKMKSMFGDKFFLSFIINKKENSVDLKSGQTVGSRYETIVENNSSSSKSYPICISEPANPNPRCSDSYELALARVSDFAIQTAITKYTLGIDANAIVMSVTLWRAGVGTLLEASKYNIVGDQIELRIDLLLGDVISVEYTFP